MKVNVVTAIEFTESEIKLLQLRRVKNSLIIQHLLNTPLPKEEESNEISKNITASKIQELIKNNNVKVKYVNFIIPKNYVTVHLVSLPSSDQDEINQMIQFEARRHIPFNPERHIVSDYTMSIDGVEGAKVLFSAIDEPIINTYLEIAQKANLKLRNIHTSSVCSFNTITVKHKELLSDKNVVIIDVGWSSSDITIANNGIVLYMRSAPIGGSALFEVLGFKQDHFITAIGRKEIERIDVYNNEYIPGDKTPIEFQNIFTDWMNKLINQIRQTYGFTRREFSCPDVERIILSGEMSIVKNLDKYLEETFGVEVIKVDPFEKLVTDDSLKDSDNLLPAFNNTIGSSITEFAKEGVRLNLLPRSYIEKVETGEKLRSLLVTAGLVLSVIVLLILYFSERTLSQKALINFYDNEVRKIEPIVKELEDKESKLQIIRSYIKDQNSAIAIMNDLESYKPFKDRLSLKEFTYIKDDSIKMLGWAVDFSDITNFKNYLEKLGYFERVKIVDRPPDDLNNHKVFRFEIECVLSKRGIAQKK